MGIAGHGVQRAYNYSLQSVQNRIPYEQPFIISGEIRTNSNTYKLCTKTVEMQTLPYQGYLTQATTITVSSNNDNDTVLGSGCRSVIVFGLDVDGNLAQSFALMNGKTPVTIATNWIRVDEMVCITFGSNVDALGDKEIEGTIYVGYGDVTDGVPENILLSNFGTDGNTRMAVYTVPIGYRLAVHSVDMSNDLAAGGSDYTTGLLTIRNIVGIDATIQLPAIDCYGTRKEEYGVPIIIPSLSSLEFRVKNNTPQFQTTKVKILVSLLEVLE